MNGRLKIAFAVHDYNRVLGHSRYVAELAERFARDHEVHVFANRFEQLPAAIVPHHVPAIRATALTSIFSFPVSASLMIDGRYDIVHAQGFTVWRADIVTAHISNVRWMEGRSVLENGQLPWRERVFGGLVIPAERRAVADRRATVIAVSSALRDHLAADYGRVSDTVVIPHGVDRQQFNPGVRHAHRAAMRAELGISDETTVFLYVGDLRKGFAPAVRAMGHVRNGHLLGISRTEPDMYLKLAAECGAADRVLVRPPTASIERCYGAADVLVLPTPYDAFGMVITEAMACGLPVITTPHAGAAELMTDGVHGMLVSSPTDVASIAAAMTRLLRADTREAMGAAAASLMLEHTWDRVAERTLDVYFAHLDRRKARSIH